MTNFLQKAKSSLVPAIICLVSAALILRLFRFIDKYSVNVFFWDQWDFLGPFFEQKGLIDRFMFQHGPHRQGLGAIWLTFLYEINNYDVRSETFWSAGFVVAGTVIAMLLFRKIFHHWQLWFLFVPAVCLSLFQYEMYIGAPNPSHGAIPFLLLMAIAYLLYRYELRFSRIVAPILAVFALFTGFGLVVAAVFSAFLAVVLVSHAIKERRLTPKIRGAIFSAVVIGAAWLIFFINYRNNPAADCVKIPHERPLEYFFFWSAGFSGSLGFPLVAAVSPLNVKFIIGASFFFAVAASMVFSALRLLVSQGEDGVARVVFLLTATSVGFFMLASVGRVCLGWYGASSSRYMIYAYPGLVGSCLHIADYFRTRAGGSQKKALILQVCLACAAILVIAKESRFERQSLAHVDYYASGKRRWAQCYSEKENIKECDDLTGWKIYPAPEATNLQGKLSFLKLRSANLFKKHDGS